MEITDIRVREVQGNPKLKAIAAIIFNNSFAIHDIKIVDLGNALFIAMPSRKTPDGEFKDISHPINSKFREKLQNAILQQYESMILE